jgi:hypothetical protein
MMATELTARMTLIIWPTSGTELKTLGSSPTTRVPTTATVSTNGDGAMAFFLLLPSHQAGEDRRRRRQQQQQQQ